MTALDPFYPCLSPESADPATIERRLVLDEIARTMHWRRHNYSSWVAKGRMSAADAEDEIDMMAAIHADLECDLLLERWHADRSAENDRAWAEQRARAHERIARFGWTALVACLRREIDRRRHLYPTWIRKGTLDTVTAAHQLERLEAAHCLYWVLGRHFWPDELGAWRPDGPDWSGHQIAAWTATRRAHNNRFLPGFDNWAGHYHNAPAPSAPAEQQGLPI